MWVISFTLRPLCPRGKRPRYHLDRRLGGPQRRSGRFGENSWPYRDSNSDFWIVQPAITTYATAYPILQVCTLKISRGQTRMCNCSTSRLFEIFCSQKWWSTDTCKRSWYESSVFCGAARCLRMSQVDHRTVIRRKVFRVFGIAHETFHRWKANNSKQQINKGYCFLKCDAVSYTAAAPFSNRRVYKFVRSTNTGTSVLPTLRKEKSRVCLSFPPAVWIPEVCLK
jgi:hypothetical protein